MKKFISLLVTLRTLVVSLLLTFACATPAFAYDQPWNGGKEDITQPTPPPKPPCSSGNCKCPPNGTGSPVYLADGSLLWSDTDISFPSATRVKLKRTYNSFDYRAGLFGRGWVTAQESNIARTYKAITEGNPDGSPKTATEFKSVPIWLASYGRRYVLEETATECKGSSVLYFTFQKLANGGFKQVFEDSQSYNLYNAQGVLLQSYSDEEGTSLYYEYDLQQRLVKEFDSYGYTLNFIYNEQGFVSQVTDQANREWRYNYDQYGRLTQMQDPDGNSKDYAYQLVDHVGYKQHLLTEVDDNGNDPVLRVSWATRTIGTDTQMRVASYQEIDGHWHHYAYTQITHAGKPAVRVVKTTKQIASNVTIHTQTFIADLDTYQIVSLTNNTDNLNSISSYDTRGNLIEEKDERGNRTLYEFNSAGKRTKITELADTANAKVSTTTYWNNTDRIAVMNEYGLRETRYTYDSDLRVLTRTLVDLSNSQQRVWTNTYHPNTVDSKGNRILGNMASLDGPLEGAQDITRFAYNTQGQLSTITNALNQTTNYAYDTAGQLISQTDPNGIVTAMSYDSQNRLLQTTRDGQTLQYTYNGQGQLTSSIDELNRTTLFEYNEQNQASKITYPSGDYTSFSYAYASTYTEITRRDYQANNSLISTRLTRNDPESQLPIQEYLASTAQAISLNQYNGLDELTQATLYGQFGNSINRYTYDAEGQLTQIQDGLNGLTKLRYDKLGRTTQVTDPHNGVTQYQYTAWGELTQTISPDTGSSDYQSDAAGNTIQHTNANNQTINYVYDGINRLTQIDYEGTDLDTTFTYDQSQNGKGQLTAITDGSGSSQYQYNTRGLLTQTNTTVAGTALNTAYNYNAADELTQISYPSGAQVITNYDNAGRLSAIQLNHNNNSTNVLHNLTWKGDNLASQQQGNGQQTEFVYDTAGRLIEKRYGGTSNRLQNTLDNQSNIIQQKWVRNDTQDINNFTYDTLSRLKTDGSPTDNVSLQFNYDANGNRTTLQKGAQSTSYQYETDSNRQSQINTTVIQRDVAGNTLNDGTRQYTYNAMNRLAELNNTTNNIQATYTYNYQGQRVRKQLSGSQTTDIRYVYGQQGELLGEYDALGNHIKEYIYTYHGIAELIAMIDINNQITYIHTDHLASPRLATNQSQTVVWRWVSDAFGTEAPNEDADGDGIKVTLNHRFPGQQYDLESGLNYNYFRDYDPSTGRYTQSDPIGLEGGLNTYEYARNNPLILMDPTGENPAVIIAAALAAARIAIARCAKNRVCRCRVVYASYKTICGIGCPGPSCTLYQIQVRAAQLCVRLRQMYITMGCDKVIPTKRDHPGAVEQAKRAVNNCKTKRDKACKDC